MFPKKTQKDLNRLIENLKFVLSGVGQSKLFFESIEENEKKLIELNTRDQIFRRGVRSDNKKIKPLHRAYPIYSKGYTVFKKSLGKFQGHVDLSLSGRYLKSYELVKLQKVAVRITSNPAKLPGNSGLPFDLKSRYGKEIEGWTDGNFKIAVGILRKTYRKKMLQIIRG